MPMEAESEFRVEKERIDAVIVLTSGESAPGHFFVARNSARNTGPERVGELLNAEEGFFPFEKQNTGGTETVLYNRSQVIMVVLAEAEARLDAGYAVATERTMTALLSNGERLVGSVRVYRPKGHHRLSDWARQPDTFRYVETGATTVLANVAQIIEIHEVPRP
jgi:hypothetical protein